jgi:hypothetical protein
MANKFNIDLLGRHVILAQQVETGTTQSVMSRIIKITGGDGCNPKGMGSIVFGEFVANPARTGDNKLCKVDAHATSQDIERIATASEISAALLEG